MCSFNLQTTNIHWQKNDQLTLPINYLQWMAQSGDGAMPTGYVYEQAFHMSSRAPTILTRVTPQYY